jgi:hypothetical protein
MNERQHAGYRINGSRAAADQEMIGICPSLILDKQIVCDVAKQVFQPSKRMIRESCTNEQHLNCPLRLMM